MNEIIIIISSAVLSGLVSLIVSFFTTKLTISIEHKKHRVPYTIRFRDECARTKRILAENLNETVNMGDEQERRYKLLSKLLDFVSSAKELFFSEYPACKPYMTKQLRRNISDESNKFRRIIQSVSDIRMEMISKNTLACHDEIYEQFQMSQTEFIKYLADEAFYAVDRAEKSTEDWLNKNT